MDVVPSECGGEIDLVDDISTTYQYNIIPYNKLRAITAPETIQIMSAYNKEGKNFHEIVALQIIISYHYHSGWC